MNIDMTNLDKDLDTRIEEFCLTKTCIELSIWRFLTVAEDNQRMMYLNITGNVEFENIADLNYKMKFIYKSAVNKIFNSMIDLNSSAVKLGGGDKFYKEYSGLLEVCNDYNIKSNFISRLFSKEIFLENRVENKYFFKYTNHNLINEYSCLEMLSNGKVVKDPFIGVLLNLYYIDNLNYQNFTYKLFSNYICLKKRKIDVKLDFNLLRIFKSVNADFVRDVVYEGEFNYKWGTTEETRKVLNAVVFRCLYHLIMIWCATVKYKFKGGFEENLVLILNKDEFINDVIELSNVENREIVNSVLEYLIYPKTIANSDAGMQSIFEFNNKLYIPCIHILESNIERNLLTLYARKEKKDFDSKSSFFEKSMTKDILKNTGNFTVHPNIKRKFKNNEEEFDLLIIDEKNFFITICELRWMLQPADPREIVNKLKACREKLKKARNKKIFFEKYKSQIAESLKIENINNYDIESIIVIDGFSGEFSGDEMIPLVTKSILNIALQNQENLRKIFDSLKSLEWLPKKDTHFDIGQFNIHAVNNEYILPGIQILDRNAKKYVENVKLFFKTY